MDTNDDFLKEMQESFIVEAIDMVSEAESCFMDFESDPTDAANMEKILRLFHNLKGTSMAVGFEGLSDFSHKAENYLIKIRDKEVAVDTDVVNNLLKCSDTLIDAFDCLKDGIDPQLLFDPVLELFEKTSSMEVKKEEPKQVQKEIINEAESNDEEGTLVFKNVEIPVAEVAQEVVEKVAEVKKPVAEEKTKKKAKEEDEFIRVPLKRINDLLNYFGEQVILQSKLGFLINGNLEEGKEDILKTSATLDKITYDLQQTMLGLRMIPLKSMFNRIGRVLRDTAQIVNKDIEFLKFGVDSELDKNIAESLIDPLTHMIRNAVDHGIEASSEERIQAGKPAKGTIEMHAFRQGANFIIKIIDDGKGIDPEVIREKAIEKGVIRPDEKLSESEILQLIFRNGFSTKDSASSVSGRGVGMDVVREMFNRLKGSCNIESSVGKGTTFTVKLPLSLSMFNGTVISSNDKSYVLPNSDYKETIPVHVGDIENLDDNGKVLNLRGQVIPVVNLDQWIGDRDKRKTDIGIDDKGMAAIVDYEDKSYAIIFDDLINQERIVLKKLGPETRKMKGVSGGAILGNGSVALVVELNKIVERYKEVS